jgi:hypothetical protein
MAEDLWKFAALEIYGCGCVIGGFLLLLGVSLGFLIAFMCGK